MASLDLLICKNRKSAKLELHNTVSAIAILVDQHIDKNCLIMFNSISSKIPEKRINNLKAFSSAKSEIQQNTHCLLTVSRFLSQFFRKLEWPLLYTH